MTRTDPMTALDDSLERARARVERTRRLTEELERLRIAGTSRDGRARVVVGPAGALEDLRLTGLAERDRSALLEASADARSALADRVHDLCHAHLDPEAADEVALAYAASIGVRP